ncbi:MAG TPA: hypothetical protein VK866_17785 [Acidimicrobiales bacterium]|nr:hypothetical protein [Acidimicrobiales bacterium]
MGIERRPGWWLWIGGPVPPGYAGITLGPLVIVRRGALTPRLLAHELEHVRQWREHGVVGFAARYVGGYLGARLRGYPHRGAYRRIPLEVRAEWRARLATGGVTAATLPPGSPPALPPSTSSSPGGAARGRTRSTRSFPRGGRATRS